ncbi:hypothetical protein H6F51_21455 [Cyanobacteria bacterium FACHB-DQ100]|nr:hypothetical protein [Cyanobacteria bacterium FACHB-DQ100]
MILTTEQNPIKVNQTTPDHLLLAIDRGNSGTKVAVSVNGVPLEPFKIPSVIRRVEANGMIQIGKSAYVCGDDAISMTVGSVSTPLSQGDKVKDLSVAIAQVIQKIAEGQILSSDLSCSLIVSSPFASDTLSKQIQAEVKPLSDGFTVKGKSYRIAFDSIRTEFEGAVLLKSVSEFNGLIDIGFGTILAAYRNRSGEVVNVPLMGGDQGGCNLVLKSLLNDPAFLAKVKDSGASAPPSVERLSAKLSEGVTELRKIDLKPLLKNHLKVLKTRIEDAALAVRTEIRFSSEDEQTSRIALVGGGAALMRLTLSDEQLSKWGEKHSIEVFDQPDFQTCLVMQQLIRINGGLN